MIGPVYYKAERFFPTKEYEVFSNVTGKSEIVSFDILLCGMINELDPAGTAGFIREVADWKSLLQVPMKSDEQIIAYYMNPAESYQHHILPDGFEFCGYDLSEYETSISAITNCGRLFDKVIPYGELNRFGLLGEHSRAVSIRKLLLDTYPNENHADCAIYELWRKLF